MAYGRRNPAWKWWLDLEWPDGKLIKPGKTNQRDLWPDRPLPKRQKIALYPLETNSPPASQEAHPVNQRAAQVRFIKGNEMGD